MKTISYCDLCRKPQSLLWPGEKNLCPDCFLDVKALGDSDISDLIAEELSPKNKKAVSLEELYSQLNEAENACGEAETDIDEAQQALADAEKDCLDIEAKIAAIKKVGQRRMAVTA